MINPNPGTLPDRTDLVLLRQIGQTRRDFLNASSSCQTPQLEFYFADFKDFPWKSDVACMEVPIFSLSSQEDLKVWKWSSQDGTKTLEVAPSVKGRATQYDKDILIFCVSQLMAAQNHGHQISRTVRFRAYDYFTATGRTASGRNYIHLREGLDRLAGTRIRTNMHTDGMKLFQGFGIIESWQLIEVLKNGRTSAVEVILSEWIFKAVIGNQVLKITPSYFGLCPVDRRLYEIARKHVGKQGIWQIGIEALKQKVGSASDFKEFRRRLRNSKIPEYRYHIGVDNIVTAYSLDAKAVIREFVKKIK